jgi:glycosyltransferase involved in cell wall biosynthesis
MRFLFVTGSYKPAVNSGGPVNTVSTLAERLVSFGHYVTVVALNEDDGLAMDVPLRCSTQVEGVEVIYFETKRKSFDNLYARFSRVKRWEASVYDWFDMHLSEYDWVHLHLGLLQPARWLAKRCEELKIPLGYHQRGNLDPRRFGRLRFVKSIYIKIIEVPVLRRCATLFALSAREEAVYRTWLKAAPVHRLPNGVDADFWSSGNSPIQNDAKVGSGNLCAVWSARWDLRKGPLEFIEMAIQVKRRNRHARFLLMGPDRGVALDAVRERLAKSDATWIGLKVGLSREERREILKDVDYFVLPTQGEGFSVGLLEALAAGCSVITTKEANFPELEGQQFGHICPAEAGEMAKVIIDSQQKPEVKRLLSKRAALGFVREHFDWDAITRVYLKTVVEIVDNPVSEPRFVK